MIGAVHSKTYVGHIWSPLTLGGSIYESLCPTWNYGVHIRFIVLEFARPCKDCSHIAAEIAKDAETLEGEK